jgi:hypothetical protein
MKIQGNEIQVCEHIEIVYLVLLADMGHVTGTKMWDQSTNAGILCVQPATYIYIIYVPPIPRELS